MTSSQSTAGETICSDQQDWESSERICSSFRSGVTEEGTMFAAGETTTELAVGQKLESLPLLFSPPFENAPELETECDHEAVRIEIVHITPSGARIQLKRNAAKDPILVQVQWYAIQSSSETPSSELP